MAGSRVALVTGCGKADGVGHATAVRLAEDGFSVVVTDYAPSGVANVGQSVPDDDGLQRLVGELEGMGVRALALLGDVGSEGDVARMFAEVEREFGRLDMLVNNASAPQGADRADIDDVSLDAWSEQVRVTLTGTFLMSKAAVEAMRPARYGRVVNISSMAAHAAAARSTAYSAAKAGVLGFTRALSMDVAGCGITVNAVCPGLVATSRSMLGKPNQDREQTMRAFARMVVVGKVGMPTDIANAVAFFADERTGHITGQDMPVHGGGMSPSVWQRPADDS